MNNEEQVFDFLAAAEDTGKQLDNLLKAIPGEVRETLATEYRKSPWLATLPATTDRVTAAAERAEAAAATLTYKSKIAGTVACVLSVALPLSTWAFAYMQTRQTKEEQASLQAETARLEQQVTTLRAELRGGAEIFRDNDGKRAIILPASVEVTHNGRLEDGRYGIWYKWPNE